MTGKPIKALLLPFTAVLSLLLTGCEPKNVLEWPEITREARPWTRWWWPGNILDKDELTRAMEEYRRIGVGGLEITPIYGVQGFEERFIPYLSPEWMDMFSHVLREAERLDLGIDMATGTGWPFGGPWVTADDACKYVTWKTCRLQEGETLNERIEYIQRPIARSQTPGRRLDINSLMEPVSENENLQWIAFDQIRFEKPMPLQLLMAYSDNANIIDLTDRVDKEGKLNWTAPEGEWRLYALFQGWHGKMVERAAPGGEGNVIDHFSRESVERYLQKFTETFDSYDIRYLRSFFNDSYEVHDAFGEDNWTPGFLEEFQLRRGYDLRNHLPALFGHDTVGQKHIRVLSDYRETISDLLLENFTHTWSAWAHDQGAITRNQAHGSPANILDLYAAADIPESEGTDIIRIKFASSAANVTGKPLIASESATWLNERFVSTLADVKTALERFILGGVNHQVYHGTPFSPADQPWPGWLFYASVHFGETNTWWEDFAILNQYLTRCQSFLQDGKPDNDILLYFPFHDWIAQPERFIMPRDRGGAVGTPARPLAEWFVKRGYSFDFISDRQIMDLTVSGKNLQTGGVRYKTLVLPTCRYISPETFEKLVSLASEGATIIIHGSLPADVNGMSNLEERQKRYRKLTGKLEFSPTGNSGVMQALVGSGSMLLGWEIEPLLDFTKVNRESMTDYGLQTIGRNHGNGRYYFIVNQGEKHFKGWVPLATSPKSIALFNPLTEEKGMACIRVNEEGATEVYLQLNQGESCLLKTFDRAVKGPAYVHYRNAGEPVSIDSTWEIRFLTGGPTLPENISTRHLISWTEMNGKDLKCFSGTAGYAISFNKPAENADGWFLDLGKVAESARIRLNNTDMGTLIAPPYRLFIPDEALEGNNRLEVEVTNLMANRIACMDREGIPWKIFHNINMPARLPENRGADGLLDTSHWPPGESGLLGPVTLTAAEKYNKPIK